MLTITIRSATIDDLPRLSEIWQEKIAIQQQFDTRLKLLPDAQNHWRTTVEAWLAADDYAIFVAERYKPDTAITVVGYSIGAIEAAAPGTSPEQIGVVREIAVDAHIPQGGMGSTLLEPLRAWFIENRIEVMVAHVPHRQVVEQAFWRASGATLWTDIFWMKL